MDSINLKNFRPDNPDFNEDDDLPKRTDSDIPGSVYHEEINTLRIDKLSNRITIISIIIPCLIGAIIIFAYLDMKERMFDGDITKQNQVEKISQQLDEKLNALDVKIAKNKFDLDNKLPALDQKSISLEGQIAKLTTTKSDAKTIENRFIKLEKRVVNNAGQDKTTIQTIERMNQQTLSAIKENQNQFDKTTQKIKSEITLFKEEFDARLLELSDYEQQIGELKKNVSIINKKIKRFEQESVSKAVLDEKISQVNTDLNNHIKNLDQQVKNLNQRLTTNLSRFQKNIDQLLKTSSKSNKPKPQINIDSSKSVTIEEESLIQ